MINDELIIESLLFVLSQPLKQSDLKKVFDNGNTPSLDDIVEKLNQKYTDNAFQISKVGGGYMLVSKKDFEPFISKSQADSPSFSNSCKTDFFQIHGIVEVL